MRRRTFLALGIFAAAAVTAIGCVDLFHPLDDLVNACGSSAACELDATVDARDVATTPAIDAPPPDGPSECAFEVSSQEASRDARRACALLGACVSPTGANALAECVIAATLAYDCQANPSQPVRGALRTYWDALRRARTCADVRAATGIQADCPATRPVPSGCIELDGGNPYESAANVRFQCLEGGAPPAGERCLVSGKVCATGVDGGGRCTGAATNACDASSCEAGRVRACAGDGASNISTDFGRDCRYFGAGVCAGDPSVPACKAIGQRCDKTTRVTCSNGVAASCPGGLDERVDCKLIGPGLDCVERVLAPGEPLERACSGPRSGTRLVDGETCTSSGAVARSIRRGVAFDVSCSEAGLSPCTLVTTLPDGPRAACAPPP